MTTTLERIRKFAVAKSERMNRLELVPTGEDWDELNHEIEREIPGELPAPPPPPRYGIVATPTGWSRSRFTYRLAQLVDTEAGTYAVTLMPEWFKKRAALKAGKWYAEKRGGIFDDQLQREKPGAVIARVVEPYPPVAKAATLAAAGISLDQVTLSR